MPGSEQRARIEADRISRQIPTHIRLDLHLPLDLQMARLLDDAQTLNVQLLWRPGRCQRDIGEVARRSRCQAPARVEVGGVALQCELASRLGLLADPLSGQRQLVSVNAQISVQGLAIESYLARDGERPFAACGCELESVELYCLLLPPEAAR